MKIVPIGAPLLPKVWQHVAPLLNKAVRLSPELIRIKDVYDAALAGVYVCWVAVDEDSGEFVGVITTRIIDYPQRKALAMDFIGGSRIKEWLGMAQEAIEEHAKRNDCSHLEGYGRRAWLKYLQPQGWEQSYITFKKELTNE